jgi:hypothetical protein
MFGGSRESLPLSVLSGAVVGGRNDDRNLGAERASLISASGVTAPALASERNSYQAAPGERRYGDSASVRSGLFMHGRDGSLSGSIGGLERRRADRDDARSLNSTAMPEGSMVTAPTSPLLEENANPTYQGLTVQEGEEKRD